MGRSAKCGVMVFKGSMIQMYWGLDVPVDLCQVWCSGGVKTCYVCIEGVVATSRSAKLIGVMVIQVIYTSIGGGEGSICHG